MSRENSATAKVGKLEKKRRVEDRNQELAAMSSRERDGRARVERSRTILEVDDPFRLDGKRQVAPGQKKPRP